MQQHRDRPESVFGGGDMVQIIRDGSREDIERNKERIYTLVLKHALRPLIFLLPC